MQQLTEITLYILKGSATTFKLYFATAIFAVPLAVIFALGKISKIKPLKILLGLYTWVFRGTPLLLQLFFAYFALPVIGIKLSPFVAASLTYILNYAAYLTEIFRAGINSIDKGQYEAAKVLGMSYPKTMMRIILPQTIKRVIPPTCNEAINLVKDSALIAAIGMGEILRNAKEILTREFIITPFVVAAIVYLIITSVLVVIFEKIEKKYSVYD